MTLGADARTVLIVEDEADCAATLDLALQTVPGITVTAVSSAEDALAILSRDPVSAVITDIQLPEMTGFELITRIREHPKLRALPIMVVSADADPVTPSQALGLGANAFFSKPFSPGALRKRLEELIHAA